jgi:hypothetical protein
MSGKSGDCYWLAGVYSKVGNKAAAEVTLAHVKALAVIAIQDAASPQWNPLPPSLEQ